MFRLVGGKISKKSPVVFKIPTAIIGIRGGIGIISIRERKRQARLDGGLTAGAGDNRPSSAGTLRLAQARPAANVVTTAQLAFGQMTMKSGGVTRAITTPGFQVVAASPTAPPSRPAPAPPEDGPGDSLSGLEGPGGNNTGGAPEAPTNEDVADTQIFGMGSNIQPQSTVVAPKFNDVPPPPPPGGVVQVGKKLTLIGKKTVIAQQNNTLDTTAGITDGVRNTGVGNNFVYGGRFLSQTPFTGYNFSTGKTTVVANRNSRGSGGKIENGFLTAPNRFAGKTLNCRSNQAFKVLTQMTPSLALDRSTAMFSVRRTNRSIISICARQTPPTTRPVCSAGSPIAVRFGPPALSSTTSSPDCRANP
ncbi:MAG: hypothetical protein VCF08_22050 [Alphaproteobacteria bacterium]